MPKRYEIEEEQWNRIKHLFPVAKTGCPTKWDNKTMFNAILYLARSGSAWKDLPSRYPPYQSVYKGVMYLQTKPIVAKRSELILRNMVQTV